MKNLFTLIFAFLSQTAKCQELKTQDLLSVKAYVFGKKSSICTNENDNDYFSVATITNNQDTLISFWVMSQSSTVYNWKMDSDSIKIRFDGADVNFPKKIELLPKSSINFFCLLQSNASHIFNHDFKLGFIYFDKMSKLLSYVEHYGKDSKVQIFWSNSVKLQDNLSYFRIEE